MKGVLVIAAAHGTILISPLRLPALEAAVVGIPIALFLLLLLIRLNRSEPPGSRRYRRHLRKALKRQDQISSYKARIRLRDKLPGSPQG